MASYPFFVRSSACRGPWRSSGRRWWRSWRPDEPLPGVPPDRARTRWRSAAGVAAVQQSVHADALHSLAGGELGHSYQVAVVGVDPTGTDEADQVQGVIRLLRASAQLEQNRPREEVAGRDRFVDTRQVLQDRLPCPQIEVAHLGVPHLALRQTDELLRGLEGAVRPSSRNLRQLGIRAWAMASTASLCPMPNPSRMTRTIGMGRWWSPLSGCSRRRATAADCSAALMRACLRPRPEPWRSSRLGRPCRPSRPA